MEYHSMGTVYKQLKQITVKKEPDYFPDRWVVELCENIHVHLRNQRLEFSPFEFIQLYQLISEALPQLQSYYLTKDKRRVINIADIDPFDTGHRDDGKGGFDCGDKTQEHRDGIEYVKKLYQEGKNVLPIAVCKGENGRYQRLDGFKRYWAQKELGKQRIKAYVLDIRIPGIQHDMDFLE